MTINLSNIPSDIEEVLQTKILDVDDCSRGVDQSVAILTTTKGKFVYKTPKRQMEKLFHEEYATARCAAAGILVPRVLTRTEKYLVETFIDGIALKEIGNPSLYLLAGHLLRKLHTCRMEGYGTIDEQTGCGVLKSQQEHLNAFVPQCLRNLYDSKLLTADEHDAAGRYYARGLELYGSVMPVLTHQDFKPDHLIYCNNNLALIDFGDIKASAPMDDLSPIYIDYGSEPHFQYLIEGYGTTAIEEIRFYSFVRLTWWLDNPADPLWQQRKALFRDIIGMN